MFFSVQQVDQLNEEYQSIEGLYQQSLHSSLFFQQQLRNKDSHEFLVHGFLRRLEVLKRCIDNIFILCPLETSVLLEKDVLLDVAINLQTFVLNVFGCFDNLAWVFVKEKGIKINRGRVGFLKDVLDDSIMSELSDELKNYLESERHDKWRKYLKDFRDALAHRIPLYVPPQGLPPDSQRKYKEIEDEKNRALLAQDFKKYYELDSKQGALGVPLFVMKHSFSEDGSRPMVFHSQVIADFKTVCEFSEKFMKF